MADAKGVGDYGGWSWAQIQTAINAGDAQTIHDAGTDFENTKTGLDDFVKTTKADTDKLMGPDGTWKGPAADGFGKIMGELLTNVQDQAFVLTPYKGAMDDAGDALTTAQTNVRTAVGQAAQNTIDRYNNLVKQYNDAIPAYNAGNGTLPPNPGDPPYHVEGGQTIADVSRYPDILNQLNEQMRTIIATLAGKYQTSITAATTPPDKPLPNPQEQPPPKLEDKLPPADLPKAGDLPKLDPNAVPPPKDLPKIAPGIGNLNLVTNPGGLKDLPATGKVAPPPLAKIDPLTSPDRPLSADLNDVPGAKFDGVLGNPNNLTAPGTDTFNPGPNNLLGAAPLGFSALHTGLTVPNSRQSVTTPGTGVLETPETSVHSDLVVPRGQVTGGPLSGAIGRGGETGAFTGGVPPMMAAGYGGMVSTGPEMEGGMFHEDVFAENEGDLTRNRKQSLVSGPENETVVGGGVYAMDDERERERRNQYNIDQDDMWGSTADASSALPY